MATQKLPPEETHDERAAGEEIADEETWEFPSSSPVKKILTAMVLLESGLVGIWKDRTDAPLCTFDVRHFRAVAGLAIEQPYERA
ncbi:MAG: hypothetical protein LC793_20600 [Thermomicrobia bacterium]|nr:hypothetical protein [Thermomicrobia bacterium]